jgi:ferrochelatase
LFIQSWVERIQEGCKKLISDGRQTTPLIFTAHSLPTAMAARSPYVEQLETSARLIADKLNFSVGRWRIRVAAANHRTPGWNRTSAKRFVTALRMATSKS